MRSGGAVLRAGAGIGTGAQHLLTDIATLALSNGGTGGVFITERDDLTVTGTHGSGSNSIDVGLTAVNGDADATGALVLVSTTGELRMAGPVEATGNVLLKTHASGKRILVESDITSSTGNVTLESSASIELADALQTNYAPTIQAEGLGRSVLLAQTWLAPAYRYLPVRIRITKDLGKDRPLRPGMSVLANIVVP